MEDIKYVKLPGRGFKRDVSSLFVRCTARLWLGPDHVLSHQSTGFSEEYKRFYFNDIQAIVASTTGRGKIINAIFLSIAGFILLLYGIGLRTHSYPNVYVYMIPAGLCLLVALINTIMGPTSRAYLITAVSKEQLHSLDRLRTARKVMDILRPLIEGAQGGTLGREALESGSMDTQPQAERPSARTHVRDRKPVMREAIARAAGVDAAQATNNYNGRLHLWLFMLLLVDAVISGLDMYLVSVALSFVGILVWLSCFGTSIACLVKQHGSKLDRLTRGLAWATMIYLALIKFAGYGMYVYLLYNGVIDPGESNQWNMFVQLASYPVTQDKAYTLYCLIDIFAHAALGLVGLVAYFGDSTPDLDDEEGAEAADE